MSKSLIDRSHDLERLRDEGYHIEVTPAGHLLLKEVPYVTKNKEVKRGTLVSKLELEMGPNGEVAKKPSNHVAQFIGEMPCDQHGSPLDSLVIGSAKIEIEGGIVVDHEFSRKIQSSEGYRDYHHKMKTYVDYLCRHAQEIKKGVTAIKHST